MGRERLYLVANVAMLSLAHGRATTGLLEGHAWGGAEAVVVGTAQLLSPMLLAAAVASAAVAAAESADHGRVWPVWVPRCILGGPVALLKLLAFPAVGSGVNLGVTTVDRDRHQ